MIQIKLDPFKTLMQNVSDNIDEGDAILFEFQTVPLDYRVKDRTTPTLFITSEKLIFAYDELIEVFELKQLEMDILGEAPKFTPWQLWFEGKYRYTELDGNSFEQLKNSTYYPRLAFNEKNQVPKEFALRSSGLVASSYQSWAMAQIVINVKNGVSSDQRLLDLFKGDFAKYNGKTLVLFFAVFVVYTIIKSAFSQYGTVFGTVLDVLFGAFSAFILWWLYKSIEKNLLAYKAVYDSYQVDELNVGKITDKNMEVRPASSVTGVISQQTGLSQSTNANSAAQDEENELVDAVAELADINAYELEDENADEIQEIDNNEVVSPLVPQQYVAQTSTISAPIAPVTPAPTAAPSQFQAQPMQMQTAQMQTAPIQPVQMRPTPVQPLQNRVVPIQQFPQAVTQQPAQPQSQRPVQNPTSTGPGIFQQPSAVIAPTSQQPSLVGKPIQPPLVGAFRDSNQKQ